MQAVAIVFDWLTAIAFGCAVMGCLTAGALTLIHSLRQLLYWPTAQAVVVRYWIVRDREHGQKFYRPVVRFTAEDGCERIAMSAWGSWRRVYRVGQTIMIRYQREEPRHIEIQGFANLWGIPLTLFSLALLLAVPAYWFRLSA